MDNPTAVDKFVELLQMVGSRNGRGTRCVVLAVYLVVGDVDHISWYAICIFFVHARAHDRLTDADAASERYPPRAHTMELMLRQQPISCRGGPSSG